MKILTIRGGGGYSYPYVQHNQNISKKEIEKAWEFFETGRSINSGGD